MKILMKVLALMLLGPMGDLFSDWVKQQLAKPYISLMHHVRSLFFVGLCAFLSILVIIASFVSFHVALYLYLPWSPDDKALLLLVLSGIYFIVPFLVIIRIFSCNWMKLFEPKNLAAVSDQKKE